MFYVKRHHKMLTSEDLIAIILLVEIYNMRKQGQKRLQALSGEVF